MAGNRIPAPDWKPMLSEAEAAQKAWVVHEHRGDAHWGHPGTDSGPAGSWGLELCRKEEPDKLELNIIITLLTSMVC